MLKTTKDNSLFDNTIAALDVVYWVIISKLFESIFSTLEVGKYQKNYDEDEKILKKLESINIFTR